MLFEKTAHFINWWSIKSNRFSDGTVPLSSALAVNALLDKGGTQVTSQIIKGENAQHSQLHENLEVDQLLINFYGLVK